MRPGEFKCSCCGECHNGPPLCIALRFPTLVARLPPAERETRCFLTQELCVVDDQYFFVYGSLELPLTDGPGPFIWGIWAAVGRKDFFRFQDLFGVEGREKEPPIPAVIGSDIPLYPPMLELKASVIQQPAGERPLIKLPETAHPLFAEQSSGIPVSRVHEIIEWNLHTRRQ